MANDPTLDPEYVRRLAIGAKNARIAEAKGKIRHYEWRDDPEMVVYWQQILLNLLEDR